jgi:4,5-DOPA dioxygenase extradiol
MSSMPTLFVSHGAPNIILRETPTAQFFHTLAQSLPAPSAVVVASAHWETTVPCVSAHPNPETIHDFGGFDPALYKMHYPAPGSVVLAERIQRLLHAAYPDADTDPQRGLDHGAWLPLLMAYPTADIPVLQLSVQAHRDAAHHYAVGKLLAPLRNEGVLIIGSGNLTHNLAAIFQGSYKETPPEVSAFADWFHDILTRGDTQTALHWDREAPHAHWNHPTSEHLLPLFVAMGAGDGPGVRIHQSVDYHTLSMDAYRFQGSLPLA